MAWLIMVVACLALDFVYTRWMIAVQGKQRWSAAIYSALCVLIGYATTLSCVEDRWLIVPACLGHALGTLLAIDHAK